MFGRDNEDSSDQVDFSDATSANSSSSDPQIFVNDEESWSAATDDDAKDAKQSAKNRQREAKREARRRRRQLKRETSSHPVLKRWLESVGVFLLVVVILFAATIIYSKVQESRHPVQICKGKVECDAENKKEALSRHTADLDLKLSDLIDDMTTEDRESVKQSDVDVVQEYITKVQKDEEKFSKLPAMKNAGVKKAFNAYQKQEAKHIAFAQNIMTVAPAASKSNKDCGNPPTYMSWEPNSLDKQTSFLATCQASINAIPDVQDESVASYKKIVGAYWAKVAGTVDAIKQLGPADQFSSNQLDTSYKLDRQLSDQEVDSSNGIGDAAKKLTRAQQDVESGHELNDLDTAIWDMVSQH
ncbi:hypothetical protein OZX67_04335 [Bifidobacterium sp. ESL0728]|uniref:hypothetical protein n=1 Tax=Bifidobacterium sp. ESL0728 TaxID=2983220 RepID=UPI0023F82E10|nr:hypothetical protein [Bifidobacterium sp. ESL0728]WEV59769.1 hypothetical protein OZX67_04335 [Bifidobacterium sp. ESL0728]